MMILGVFGGMLRSLIRMGALLIVLAVGWLYRDTLIQFGRTAADRWEVLRKDDTVAFNLATPELAAVAQAKLDDVQAGFSSRVAFTTEELQSLLVYRYSGLLPAFVDSPRVSLEGDRVRLRVRVPISRIPEVDELGEIAGVLPDTTELDVRGQLLPMADGRVSFAVDEVSAHRIPLPHRLVPMALDLLGRKDEPGLLPDAISIPLPPGATGAYVRADSLILLTGRTQAN